MPNILFSACDPHSWLNTMDAYNNPPAGNAVYATHQPWDLYPVYQDVNENDWSNFNARQPNATTDKSLYDGSRGYVNGSGTNFSSTGNAFRPQPMVIDLTGSQEVFVKFRISAFKNYSRSAPSGTTVMGDFRKFFQFNNTQDKEIFTVGWNWNKQTPTQTWEQAVSDYQDNFSGQKISANNVVPVVYSTDGAWSIYTFDGTSNEAAHSAMGTWGLLDHYTAHDTQYPNQDFFIHAKLDTANNASSFIRVYKGSRLQAELLGADCHTNGNSTLKNLTICPESLRRASYNTGYSGMWLSELIVADHKNFSLRAYPVKPSQLTGNNQFSTGGIENINTLMQDRSYLTSPNIVSTVAEFQLARPADRTVNQNPDTGHVVGDAGHYMLQGVHKIQAFDAYAMTRFVDPNTAAVKFGFSVHNDSATPVVPQVQVTEAANWDDTRYHTKKISHTQLNMDVSGLTNLRARVEILGAV